MTPRISVVAASLMAFCLASRAENPWRLAWSDEFDGPEIDASVWSFEEGWKRNGEAQYYTVGRRENACIEDGKLVITARKEKYPNRFYDPAAPTNDFAKGRMEADYTSASLLTRGKFTFQYGKLEVRAKVPESLGTWPAIWMCGQTQSWPKCGEIDVMEAMGCEPGRLFMTSHWADPLTGEHVGVGGGLQDATFADGFHLYGIEWDENKIDFFFDEEKCHTQDISALTDASGFNPFRQPHYPRLNLAFGGSWAGRRGVDDTALPIRYEIDYVRIYKRGAIAVPEVFDVTLVQVDDTGVVEVGYSLSNAPAIVIVDICTNGVSIGDANLHYFTGDCNRVVAPGSGKKVHWQMEKSWPGHRRLCEGMTAKVHAWALDNPPDYMVADLVEQNSVNYYASVEALPDGGLTNDVYRTDRLVMRRIHAAGETFGMGADELPSTHPMSASERPHKASLDHDYWIGVFEFTQGQYAAVGGPSQSMLWETDGACRPVANITYNKIRESSTDNGNATYRYPNSPAPGSLLGKLNERTGLVFDLPGEAEWEYACRAGTASGMWNDGSEIESSALNDSSRYRCSSEHLAHLGRYMLNGGMKPVKTWYETTWAWDVSTDSATARVGTYAPNGLGLYDMHGNVCEICLDYYKADITDDNGTINTTANETDTRVARGGGYASDALECRSAYRANLTSRRIAGETGVMGYSSEIRGNQYGFRVVCRMDTAE